MKILIANRGEIAVRIMRACREMGLASVAVYSDIDRAALHVRYADEAYGLGANEAASSYLSIEKMLDVAARAGADAVHPGYGFLAENASFAKACTDAGLTFIGPSPDVIERMGSKTAARQLAALAGVPLVPGSQEALTEEASLESIAETAESIGYPLMVKAVAAGGGKGMREAASREDLPSAVRAARSEARSAFGKAAIYLERRLLRPRHIEIQVLGDGRGRVVPFVERECSIQRRHQKVVEESPSPVVDRSLREALAAAAVSLAEAVDYAGAGTVEFLLDEDRQFYFLEMNTRLQVEHPVTECVTGVDLVRWQIRIARGEPLDLPVERLLEPTGHALECRVYAEDPDNRFLPSPGRVVSLRPPSGPGIRDDEGVAAGSSVSIFYDPLISKLVAWGEDRPHAIARMSRALDDYELTGIKTTIPFFQWLMRQEDFAAGRFDTVYLDRLLDTRQGQAFAAAAADLEGLATMGVALHQHFESTHGSGAASESGARTAWQDAARREALR